MCGRVPKGQTLQSPIESIEVLLDEGLGLTAGTQLYGVELEVEEGLMRMDTVSRVKAAQDALKGGMTVNEARRRFYGYGPVPGGDAVYLQQQNYSIEALAKRDAQDDPFGVNKPAPTLDERSQNDSSNTDEPSAEEDAKQIALLITKASEIAKRSAVPPDAELIAHVIEMAIAPLRARIEALEGT